MSQKEAKNDSEDFLALLNRDGHLRDADLRGKTPGKYVRLHEIDMSGADLRGADLRGINLKDSKLARVNIAGANLTSAQMNQPAKMFATMSGLEDAWGLDPAIFAAAVACGYQPQKKDNE